MLETKIKWRIFNAQDSFLSHKYSPVRNSDQELILEKIGAKSLALCDQEHGEKAVYVGENYTSQTADAMVTAIPNIALGIKVADCVCVLLYSLDGSVIGAAHLGWRGAKASLLSNTLHLMKKYSQSQICAIISPCIRQLSYEVDTKFYQNFTLAKPTSSSFFAKQGLKLYFDLPGFIKQELANHGIENIIDEGQDTFSCNKYFSYRAASQKGQKEERRMLCCIAIDDHNQV